MSWIESILQTGMEATMPLSFHVQGGGIGGFDDLGSVLVSMWCCTIVYMHTGYGLLYCVEGPFVLEQEK